MEMIWRGNDDYPERDLFTGELYHHSYGPPPGFTWGHDFYDIKHAINDPIIDNPNSDEYNLDLSRKMSKTIKILTKFGKNL